MVQLNEMINRSVSTQCSDKMNVSRAPRSHDLWLLRTSIRSRLCLLCRNILSQKMRQNEWMVQRMHGKHCLFVGGNIYNDDSNADKRKSAKQKQLLQWMMNAKWIAYYSTLPFLRCWAVVCSMCLCASTCWHAPRTFYWHISLMFLRD